MRELTAQTPKPPPTLDLNEFVAVTHRLPPTFTRTILIEPPASTLL